MRAGAPRKSCSMRQLGASQGHVERARAPRAHRRRLAASGHAADQVHIHGVTIAPDFVAANGLPEDQAGQAELLAACRAQLGECDILVNNAAEQHPQNDIESIEVLKSAAATAITAACCASLSGAASGMTGSSRACAHSPAAAKGLGTCTVGQSSTP